MPDHSINETLLRFHNELHIRFARICRIAVALYDDQNRVLKTFSHSTDNKTPLAHYEVNFDDVPSLQELARHGEARVLQDLSPLIGSPAEHSQKILQAGYQSSYTVPLMFEEKLLGFLFFDATCTDYFTDTLINKLAPFAKVLAAIISVHFSSIRALNGTVVVAREFSRYRDEETANHLKRMSAYSRQIAMTIADKAGLNDEDIEFIYRFSQLHDLGKIAISDSILLKPGKLTEKEFSIIKTHVEKGVEMAEIMIREFGLEIISHIDLLTNIIGYHHESYDGTGYPHKAKGEAIPIEARIVKVADVFDSLTTTRPYKKPWELDDAFAYLQQHSGTQFDPACVQAALDNREKFVAIHNRFHDEAEF